MASQYERLRLKNIEDNKRVLAELGLMNPFLPMPKVVKRGTLKRKREEPTEKRKKFIITTSSSDVVEGYGSQQSREGRRRSTRLKGGEAPTAVDIKEEVEEASKYESDEEEGRLRKPLGNRPMVYGPIPGLEVGTMWQTRMEANYAGVHRPPVSGIHGGPQGTFSIALSGGYEDDIDLGECFTYTGEGGRDLTGTKAKPKNLRTASQSKDQCLSKGNASLVMSVESGLPVRVIRGYKLRSNFAPEDGYRYDGLYKVEKYWFTTGMSGFGVYKFALKRLEDQAPPPWDYRGEQEAQDQANNNETAKETEGSDSQDLGMGDDSAEPTSEVHMADSQDSGIESELPSKCTSDAESDDKSSSDAEHEDKTESVVSSQESEVKDAQTAEKEEKKEEQAAGLGSKVKESSAEPGTKMEVTPTTAEMEIKHRRNEDDCEEREVKNEQNDGRVEESEDACDDEKSASEKES